MIIQAQFFYEIRRTLLFEIGSEINDSKDFVIESFQTGLKPKSAIE
jgi:hypothetical protein